MFRYNSSLSSWDDFPVHQVAETIRHVGTSDRNFYDRYYFNLHGSSDELFMVMGLGVYPNLGVTDAFCCVRRGDFQHVVRSSKVLRDRMDTTVGPIRVEVLEPLHRLRFVCDPDSPNGAATDGSELQIAADLVWEGSIPAYEEPRQFVRKHGRVMFDTMRFAQTGNWSGTIEIAGETITATPDRFGGTRDRSWGVRPHGEPEHPGIRQGEGQLTGMWNYDPMQFADHSILYMLNEEADGTRVLEEAVRIWSDPKRGVEHLGRPEYEHTLTPGTRMVTHSMIRFPEAPHGALEIDVEPLLPAYIAIGTGYGIEDDWRHGMFQGELAVQGRSFAMADIEPFGHFTIVDQVARFTQSVDGTPNGVVGFGLHEHAFLGPFPKYGMDGPHDGAR